MKPITLRANEVRRLQTAGEVLVVRKVKDQPVPASALSRASPARLLVSDDDWVAECRSGSSGYVYTWPRLGPVNDRFVSEQCPLGTPTERRWVRETWLMLAHPSEVGLKREHIPQTWDSACDPKSRLMYRAEPIHELQAPGIGVAWRSPVTMPRWASRYVVEIAEVQARQVQAITEAEAIAAGVQLGGPIGHIPSYLAGPYAYHFAQLWDCMNGPDSWSANPWAWFVRARRVDVSRRQIRRFQHSRHDV